MYPEISLHIDGAWCKAASGKTDAVLNPATGEEIGRVPIVGKADLDRALAAAQKGFEAWRKVSAFERYKLMRKAAEILRGRGDEIGKICTLEQGKPFAESRLEPVSGADVIDWFAEE
ncbi:MAG: aldehyde dehydrogenase family protein, partial [Alphaproteobacteria bacterium]|nr:aldehyde dehydrogenase family protein [Alphaproteobacteria bacterium]